MQYQLSGFVEHKSAFITYEVVSTHMLYVAQDAHTWYVCCIQAQEQLLDVPWPRKLLDHPFCAPVTLGEVCAARNPDIAMTVRDSGALPLEQQGPLVMNGLRVRMGINTGVPDDIFVHDLTEHVEYRGGVPMLSSCFVELMTVTNTLTEVQLMNVTDTLSAVHLMTVTNTLPEVHYQSLMYYTVYLSGILLFKFHKVAATTDRAVWCVWCNLAISNIVCPVTPHPYHSFHACHDC